ncbi:rhomboid-related protein 1 isoform X2 [Phocoena sinus]|uniref:rhomboid-related protein 1 isoform X2 n=1 Tax=Phocoena sinus TaxID=42100 RepID=UPI0013C44373|nr:rhomboid-related protein 1 isoform X2 [Phocoena sinus]
MDRSSLLQLIQEQQLDPENTGFIGADTFAGLVHRHELPLDPAKLDMLVALAQSNERGQVCYQELVDLISSKRSSSFKRAIANGQRALPQDGLLDEPGLGVYKRFVRYVAYEILPREVDRHWYFYRHRSCPPPVFMASVTLAQIIVFLCYGARLNKWVLQTYHPEYMKSPLVYHPGHRARAWRFLTYMFMHVGLEQLGFNALLQLMIGVPLEMVHGLLRISLLYLAGVLAGSLTVSITDMRAPVVGGSGGVYALCSAHLANVVMNWAGMRCPYKLLRMVLALVCTMRNACETSVAGGWCCLPMAPSCSSPSSGTSLPTTCWVPTFPRHPDKSSQGHTSQGAASVGQPLGRPACSSSVNVCLEAASSWWVQVAPVAH